MHQRHGALLFGGHLGVPAQRRRRDVDEDEFAHKVRRDRAQPDRGQPAQRHPDDEVSIRRQLLHYWRDRGGVVLRRVVTVVAPRGMSVAGKVHRQRRLLETHDHGVPGVRVLPATVEEHHPRRALAPLQRADGARIDAMHVRQRTRDAGLLGVLGQQRELG